MINFRALFTNGAHLSKADLDSTKRNVFVLLNKSSDRRIVPLARHVMDFIEDKYNVIRIVERADAHYDQDLLGRNLVDLSVTCKRRSDIDNCIARLIAKWKPFYALAFGLESTDLTSMLEWRQVPVVMLVSRLLDEADLRDLNKIAYTTTKIACPAQLICDALGSNCPSLRARDVSPLPLPAVSLNDQTDRRSKSADSGGSDEGALLVFGHGPLDFQGGLDLFVSVAAKLKNIGASNPRVHFAWCGSSSSKEHAYYGSCQEQIRLMDLRIQFFESTGQLDAIHAQRRLCLLTSRLDIFPESALAEARNGTPVLCFADATSLACVFSDAGLGRLVVPYLDVDEAACRLEELAKDQELFREISRQTQAALYAAFAAGSLAEAVNALGLKAAALTKSFDHDYSTIKRSGVLDDDFYFGVEPRDRWRDATREYLHASKIAHPTARSDAGLLVRRPVPGFHPLVYASHRLSSRPELHENALAHYIRAGSPTGPWRHRVLDMRAIEPTAPANMRVAVHAHFHYPELLDDLLDRLRHNRTPTDLFLTTTSNDRKDALDHQLKKARVSAVRVDIVPNVGRDVGPLLGILKENCLSNYDLICHVHGKRSVQLASGKGDTWRTFLWENLIGGEVRAVDIIAEAFVADPGLGLLFAEENTLTGWDNNKEICSRLLNETGWRKPLPDHFDFPVGTMFWARPAALEPLRTLDLTWSDYPPEPIAEDGTLLHAIERMIPFSAAKAGFDYATTFVRGVSH